jgi:hypothetical protein
MNLGFYDNPREREWFEKYLIDYDPAGIWVSFDRPIHGKGQILEQKGAGPGAFFTIHLETPISFGSYFQQAYLMRIPADQKKMEAAIYHQLWDFGMIEESGTGDRDDDKVTGIYARWIDTTIIGFKKGLPVTYVEHDSTRVASIKVTYGIVKDVYKTKGGRGIVEMFLLDPLTWYRAPIAIDTDYLKPEHVSKHVTHLTREGVYRDWQTHFPGTIPPGHMTDDKEEYILDEPIDLAQVKEMADKIPNFTPEDRLRFWLEAALFHIIPIDVTHDSGKFKPMRREDSGLYLGAEAGQITSMKRLGERERAEVEEMLVKYTMSPEDVELAVRWIRHNKERAKQGLPKIDLEEYRELEG